MEYHLHVNELDNGTDYPLLVLSGMTGLSQEKIRKLGQEGHFRIKTQNGEQVVNGKEFLDWAASVNHTVEVKKTNVAPMKVKETE
jgi:hypothetical protein